ncbi:hypothetical protein D3C81_1599240 [compost metagenome]
MSDSAMPFQPAIELPSNILPSSNSAGSTIEAGKVRCCSIPRMSTKRRSMNSIWLSLISFSTFSRDIGWNLGWIDDVPVLQQLVCQLSNVHKLLFSLNTQLRLHPVVAPTWCDQAPNWCITTNGLCCGGLSSHSFPCPTCSPPCCWASLKASPNSSPFPAPATC